MPETTLVSQKEGSTGNSTKAPNPQCPSLIEWTYFIRQMSLPSAVRQLGMHEEHISQLRWRFLGPEALASSLSSGTTGWGDQPPAHCGSYPVRFLSGPSTKLLLDSLLG